MPHLIVARGRYWDICKNTYAHILHMARPKRHVRNWIVPPRVYVLSQAHVYCQLANPNGIMVQNVCQNMWSCWLYRYINHRIQNKLNTFNVFTVLCDFFLYLKSHAAIFFYFKQKKHDRWIGAIGNWRGDFFFFSTKK